MTDSLHARAEAMAKALDVAASREWKVVLARYPSGHEAAALIRELLAEREWRPIETAPKDGTVILAWNGFSPHAETVYWGRSAPMHRAGWLGGHCSIDHIDQPKSWMPLPPPPKDKP